WVMVGLNLVRSQNYSKWLVVAPVFLAVAAFFVGPGQLILARWRWEKIFYALTDQRLLVRNQLVGNKLLTYQLRDFKQSKQKQYGKQLLSLRLFFKGSAPIVLECLEQPDNFLQYLPKKDAAATSDSNV
ncbi:MAG: hypothetical protein KAG12_04170, partial [Desulfuromusa sp.]|nr:hypothetical protein [Desulfuromusa sp.]